MTTTPRVSVISAWFDRSHDIEASISSILEQDGVEFEYIIVDDASSDEETLRYLDTISSHPRVRLIRNEVNIGFTRSMRVAADAARGEYIAVQDAGDISLPGRLQKQKTYLDENRDCVLVGTGVENFDVDTKKRTVLTTHHQNPIRGVNGRVFSHGEVMYRADAYRKVGGYREFFYYSQDTDLWRRLAEIGEFGHVDEMLYERRIFSDGVRGDQTKRVAQAIFGNMAMVSAQARQAGKRDPIDQHNTLSILKQSDSRRFESYAERPLKELVKNRQWDQLADALSVVPAGMMTNRMVRYYALCRLFGRGSKK